MKETKGRKISQDRGGYCWCLVPWYECMLMHIAGIPSWCSIRCLFIRVRSWVVATLPWLELAWYIWVTNSRYEYGAKFRWTQHCLPWKQELTPSCDLEVYTKQFFSVWMIPTNVLVYGRTWYIWIVVVIISEYWDWNWTTCMETNEKILICLQAIKNHSDATPSYALMRSYRRGLWRIRRDSNLYLLIFRE